MIGLNEISQFPNWTFQNPSPRFPQFIYFCLHLNYFFMKINGRLIVFTLILIALQTTCKLLFAPRLEWSGFSPFIAIALFSGFVMKERNISFVLPLLALFIIYVI